MSGIRVTWRPAADAEDAIPFVSRPRGAVGELGGRSLGELRSWQDLSRSTPHSTPVVIHSVFGDALAGCVRIPHRYIHLCMATARDGTHGEGSSLDPHRAIETSICEVMERYFGTMYDPESLTYGSYRDLGPEAVNPRDLVLLRDWEHERTKIQYVRYSDELPLHWCRGFQILQGNLVPCLLPATLAVMKFSWSRAPERFAPSLSPGTASGRGYLEAILHGVYELVERDAFILAWLNRLSCPRIHVREFSAAGLTVSLERLRADGFDATFVDLTTELGIPVALSIIGKSRRAPDEPGYLSFGLGANLDPQRALERAYREALEIMTSFYDFADPSTIRTRKLEIPDGSLDLADYFRFCEFLTASPEIKHAAPAATPAVRADTTDELHSCIAVLADAGVDVYFVDLTPANLQSVAYRLVRVLASRLQPHLYEWDCWRLDNPRIYSVPVDMGYRATPLAERDLNLIQNPFAVLSRARHDRADSRNESGSSRRA